MSVPISASVQVMMVSSAGSVRQAGRQCRAAAAGGGSGGCTARLLNPPAHIACCSCTAQGNSTENSTRQRRAGRCRAHRLGAGIQCRLISGGSAAAACGHSLPSPPAPRCGFAAGQDRQGGGALPRRAAASAGGRQRQQGGGSPSPSWAAGPRAPAALHALLTSIISTLTCPVPRSSQSPSSFSRYTLTRCTPGSPMSARVCSRRAPGLGGPMGPFPAGRSKGPPGVGDYDALLPDCRAQAAIAMGWNSRDSRSRCARRIDWQWGIHANPAAPCGQ